MSPGSLVSGYQPAADCSSMVTLGFGRSGVQVTVGLWADGSSVRGSFEKNWANSSVAFGEVSSSAFFFWFRPKGRSAIAVLSSPISASLRSPPYPLVDSQ